MRNPFPLEDPGYAEAQAHSAEVDAWLGLEIDTVEARIRALPRPKGARLWEELPPATFLTPYTEFRQILERLKPESGEVIADLGAGYGRLAFVMGRHFPEAEFVGYELSAERAGEANRVLARQGLRYRVEVADLTDPYFQLPAAHAFFIYDFGTREAVAGILAKLRAEARARPIAVVGRGRLTRDLIERDEPWLSQVVPPQVGPRWSIYRSAS